MSETTNKARALLAAATKGSWSQCGADRGGCTCGLVWSIEFDVVVATATGEAEGGTIPDEQRIANAALIAAAPTLIATLCDEADIIERLNENQAELIDQWQAKCARIEAERDALRADLEKERAKVRKAVLCDCALVCREFCPDCSGSGAVIVEGET